MKTRPLVSVVVNFYNQAHLAPRALRSVLEQTYENLDVIVVDDGSEDNIAEVVAEFDDPRLRFFQQENSGVATARNLGIEKAKGEYIAFLDGDDVFLPTKTEEQMKCMQEEAVKVIAVGCYFLTKRGWVIGRRICGKYKTNPGDSTKDYPKINPSLLIYHNSVFHELGGFPSSFRIGEDGMFNRLVFNRYSIVSLPQPLVLKERDDDGKSRSVFYNYDNALESYRQKVACVEAFLGGEDLSFVISLFKKSSLCGFLAVGNMAGAKRWYRDILDAALPYSGRGLERFSVNSGINIYLIALHARNVFSLARYFHVSVWYQKFWR